MAEACELILLFRFAISGARGRTHEDMDIEDIFGDRTIPSTRTHPWVSMPHDDLLHPPPGRRARVHAARRRVHL